ncbi:hypothetical protein KRR26_31380 [Corallococcus sp. M34]|uniref:hypothetical protein n=1 Tax=Citreicoccus inhibens TaxID=2849499 RepID=UPI001C22D337|nr:hypothetical protein [Citreicoccus inhibens]MBU8900117.1 hypothetical protein [Citreicoccus inhibens]
MTQKTADDIRGLEYDWLAVDADGHVGFFSTAGGGYAPDGFLADAESFGATIEALEASPATTTARFAPSLTSEYTNSWRLMAERGLFAFDSDFFGGPYRLVAAPEVPVRVTDLPARVVEVLTRVVLRDLRFREQAVLSAETLAEASRT